MVAAGAAVGQTILSAAPAGSQPLLTSLPALRGSQEVPAPGLKLDGGREHPDRGMAGPLGAAAKQGGWFKDIDPAEQVALEAVAPNLGDFREPVQRMVENLRDWCNRGPAAPGEVAPAAPVAG